MFRSAPAWHKLGKVFGEDENILPSEAARAVSGDVDIRKLPMLAQLPDGSTQSTDRFGVFRMPTHDDPSYHFMGGVTDRWEASSYTELAERLDPIGKRYAVETCGVLQKGKRLFMALRGEDWAVLGKDEMRTYFGVCLSLQPNIGHKVRHTPVRVVCWNTEQMADARASIQIAFSHGANAGDFLELAANLIVRFRETEDATKALFNAMAKVRCTPEMLEQVASAAFPEPSKPKILRMFDKYTPEQARIALADVTPEVFNNYQESINKYEQKIERQKALRLGVVEQFDKECSQEHLADLRGSVWAAYNAVTELADWRGKTYGEGALFGSRAGEKERAFEACLNVAGLNTN